MAAHAFLIAVVFLSLSPSRATATAWHGLVVRNASGFELANIAGHAWEMGFGTLLNGNFSVRRMEPSSLCSESDPAVRLGPGVVLLGGGFFGVGCSYETRARVAQRMNATGILFKGHLHTPYDWDGSSWDGIRLGAAVAWEHFGSYDDVEAAVRDEDGSTLEIGVEPTPLDEVSFAVFQWVLLALLLLASLVPIVAGAMQMRVMYRPNQMGTARLVILLETISQLFLFVRNLNGPGYDLTHRMLVPHYVYRVFFAITYDLHSIVLLVVSSQLRSTLNQIRRRMVDRNTDGLSEMSIAQATKTYAQICFGMRHEIIALFVVVFVIGDLVFAVLDGLYVDYVDPALLVTVQGLYFFLMGIYYLTLARAIDRALKDASRFKSSSARVEHFSKNVRFVGIAVIVCFLAFLCFAIFNATLGGLGVTFYVVTTAASFVFFMGQVIQAYFLITSYQMPGGRRSNARSARLEVHTMQSMETTDSQRARAATDAEGIFVDVQRFSGDDAMPSPNVRKASPLPRRFAPPVEPVDSERSCASSNGEREEMARNLSGFRATATIASRKIQAVVEANAGFNLFDEGEGGGEGCRALPSPCAVPSPRKPRAGTTARAPPASQRAKAVSAPSRGVEPAAGKPSPLATPASPAVRQKGSGQPSPAPPPAPPPTPVIQSDRRGDPTDATNSDQPSTTQAEDADPPDEPPSAPV